MPDSIPMDLVQEYFKCKNDPNYFISKYVKIEIPGETIPLPMYDVQKIFLESILIDHHVIALKSRQTGISTITQAYICYVHTFYKNIIVGVVSKDGPEATDFCRKTRSMIESLPKWLRPSYVKDTEQTYILDNGCQFYAQTINPRNPGKLFRGKSITIAVMDEAAHADYIDAAWTGFGPALVKAQNVAKKNDLPYATIIISTPNGTTGTGRWYYESWKEAQTTDSIYKPHLIHWEMVPEFKDDSDWYREQCKILKNQKKIDQELELKFISSETSFFPPSTIEVLNSCTKQPIKTIKMFKSNLLLWELPDKTKFYYIGVDTASSHGGDKSTVEVIDYETMRQIAEYRGKLRISDEFTKVVEHVGNLYPNSLIIVENNSYGETIAEYLTNAERRHKFNVYSSKYKYGDKKETVWGLSNTGKTRPLMIDSLYTYITEEPEIVKSSYLALELIGLEESTGGKVEAGRGMRDDLALAYSMCTYVRMYDPKAKMIFAPRTKMYDSIDRIINLNDDVSISFNSEIEKNLQISQQKEFDLTKRNSILKRYIKSKMDAGEEVTLEDILHGADKDKDDSDFTMMDIF